MSVLPHDYPAKIASLHAELGITTHYAEERKLTLQEEAADLLSIGLDDNGRDCLLSVPAAAAWQAMRTQAQQSAVEIVPLSGFRSVARQVEIIRGKLALGETLDVVLRSMAAPGYSEHHTGRAIDVGTRGSLPLDETFVTTAAYAWLAKHAVRFGFRMSYPRRNPHGFVFEPWHWCWHP